MANYTNRRGHNPKKPGGKRITANLANLAIVESLPMNRTEAIDTSLLMMSIVKDAALEGNPAAIALLARLGLEVSLESLATPFGTTIVLRPDGETAAWIV